MAKRFEVLYGDGKCCIREMPGKEFTLKPGWHEDAIAELAREVEKYFHCKVTSKDYDTINTDLPADYELCGICHLDHAYDGSTPEGKRQIDILHEEGRDGRA